MWALAATLVAAGASAAGCGVYEDLPPVVTATPIAQNLLSNGSFEQGSQPWAGVEGSRQPFVVTDARAHSGSHSLALRLADGAAGESGVSGIRQPAFVQTFPEFLSGMYFVETWDRGGGDPYLEFTVTAVEADVSGAIGDRTIRFLITGTDTEPVLPDGTTVVFLERAEPEIGEWTYFGYPVQRAFEERFGAAPAAWTRVDITLNVRYEAGGGAPAPSALVYYDDIYLGPQVGNTNRPEVHAGG